MEPPRAQPEGAGEAAKLFRQAKAAHAAGDHAEAKRLAEQATVLLPGQRQIENLLAACEAALLQGSRGAAEQPTTQRRPAAPPPASPGGGGGAATAKESAQKAMVAQALRGGEDHWAVLGVARGAGDDEVKKAYRKSALLLHPDKCAVARRGGRCRTGDARTGAPLRRRCLSHRPPLTGGTPLSTGAPCRTRRQPSRRLAGRTQCFVRHPAAHALGGALTLSPLQPTQRSGQLLSVTATKTAWPPRICSAVSSSSVPPPPVAAAAATVTSKMALWTQKSCFERFSAAACPAALLAGGAPFSAACRCTLGDPAGEDGRRRRRRRRKVSGPPYRLCSRSFCSSCL